MIAWVYALTLWTPMSSPQMTRMLGRDCCAWATPPPSMASVAATAIIATVFARTACVRIPFSPTVQEHSTTRHPGRAGTRQPERGLVVRVVIDVRGAGDDAFGDELAPVRRDEPHHAHPVTGGQGVVRGLIDVLEVDSHAE